MKLELVEQIVVLLGEYPVSEITVAMENTRVHVCRPLNSALPVAAFPAETTVPPVVPEPESRAEESPAATQVLTAPMVGIFYHTEPPLPLASEMKIGQVVGCIESMKLMNDVAAEAGGKITEILVEDGVPVEYGQALFRLAAL